MKLIQQLMDFKLIHVVEPDTSAASGRPGRYEAYTLDFSLFMEPRRRNIEIVEFGRIDDQSRRVGIREAPVYSLERARKRTTIQLVHLNPTLFLRSLRRGSTRRLVRTLQTRSSHPCSNQEAKANEPLHTYRTV